MNSLEFQSFIEKQLQSEKILHSYMFYGENIEEYNEQILLFLYSTITVSYTHLTLPTSDLV